MQVKPALLRFRTSTSIERLERCWQSGQINLLSNLASVPPVYMHTPLRIGERRPEALDPVPGLVLQGPFRNPRFRWLDSLGWII